jgi:bacillithiol synthase
MREGLIYLDKGQEQEFYPPLFLDYKYNSSRVKGLYTHHYQEPGHYRDKAAFLRESFPGESRRSLGGALEAYNKTLEAGKKTFENIGLLQQEDAVAVVTGQQAGVLGGPLFTFYKAAGAVALAQKLSRELKVPVVPVFWIAAEDHDFQEVNHLILQGQGGNPREIELPAKSDAYALEYVPLDQEGAAKFLEEYASLLPESEFKGETLARIRQSMENSATLTQWFGRLMAWLCKDTGLVFFNPLMPGIRRLAGPFLSSVGLKRQEMDRLLQARDREIVARGYPLQVKGKEGQLHLFAFLEGGRAALFFKEGRVLTRQGEDLGALEEVAAKIAAEPGKYGPNVLTRPLLQEIFLPTVSYIGGPGEISYFAQVEPLYALFGLKAPVLYPRPGVTLLEPRMADYMDKYNLQERDLFRPRDAFKDYVREKENSSIEEIFTSLERALSGEYRVLKEKLAEVDKSLEALTDTNLRRILKEVAYLKGKGEQAMKDRHKTAVRHFANLENACLPSGQLQERTYNIFSYLIKYGPAVVQDLQEKIPLAEGHYIHRWQ